MIWFLRLQCAEKQISIGRGCSGRREMLIPQNPAVAGKSWAQPRCAVISPCATSSAFLCDPFPVGRCLWVPQQYKELFRREGDSFRDHYSLCKAQQSMLKRSL